MKQIPTVDELIASPCTSYWLKDALRVLSQRDVLDASRDAEILALVMQKRCEDALGITISRRRTR